ncbi:hypothetical protein [Xanthobacter agilis]|uniref:hypothetical protein n=1 Tax=Xanthobacter agilis TaxID=47492 RepID=UPI003726AA4C
MSETIFDTNGLNEIARTYTTLADLTARAAVENFAGARAVREAVVKKHRDAEAARQAVAKTCVNAEAERQAVVKWFYEYGQRSPWLPNL